MLPAFLVGIIFLSAFVLYEKLIQRSGEELNPCFEEYKSLLKWIEQAATYSELSAIESEIEDFYEAYEKFVEIELLNDRWKHLNQMLTDKRHVMLKVEAGLIANQEVNEVRITDLLTAN